MSFDFQYESSNNSNRQSFRVSYQGLLAQIGNTDIKANVLNMSSTGIALEMFSHKVKNGDILTVSLLLEDNVLISHIKIKVVFANYEKNFIGCEYHEFTRNQGKKIDIIILKLQKLEIQKQKMKVKRQEEVKAAKKALETKDFERSGTSIYDKGQHENHGEGENVNIFTKGERIVIKDENAINIYNADNPDEPEEEPEIISISKWGKD